VGWGVVWWGEGLFWWGGCGSARNLQSSEVLKEMCTLYFGNRGRGLYYCILKVLGCVR